MGAMLMGGCLLLCVILPIVFLYIVVAISIYRRKAFSALSWGIALALPLIGAVALLCVFGKSMSDMDARSELYDAACDGDLQKVKDRVAAGDPIDETWNLSGTALECAAGNRHVAVAKFLLEHGADPDAKCGNDCEFEGTSPREWAEELDEPELKRLFAKYPKHSKSRIPTQP